MYPPPLNRDTLERYTRRIESLRPDSPRLWGKLTVTDMVHHLNVTLRGTIEGLDVPDVSDAWNRRVMRYLALYLVPSWPKGKVKMPDALTPPAEDEFDAERRVLIDYLPRFVEATDREPRRKVPHPKFGALTYRQWQRLHGRHLDHHLTQFGA